MNTLGRLMFAVLIGVLAALPVTALSSLIFDFEWSLLSTVIIGSVVGLSLAFRYTLYRFPISEWRWAYRESIGVATNDEISSETK